ncbi:MAG TPA: hypothetical protein VFE16_03765 [Candidatus Cybelea sp.]|jgi:hypothetical protein|nr:hypothetical protein [Candidatus Cybelea sp.]
MRRILVFALFAPAFVALTACDGEPPAASHSSVILSVATTGSVVEGRPDTGASFIEPGAASGSLLYVSDLGNFDVRVFTYPALKPAGKLTGFVQPQGECVDRAGNIWIANSEGTDLREYAHGGTKEIARVSDALGYPAGCAVDPKSGNLAVTNIENFSGNANVLVYKRARGTPAVYGNTNLVSFYFAAYDSQGNLYVSARSSQSAFSLGVLARGAHSIALVTLSGGTIYFPGTVAWSGTQLVLGDQRCKNTASSCLYRLTVSGKTARIAGATPLGGACDVAQAWISAARVAGGDYANCSHKGSSADLWPYPAGGRPTARVTGFTQPVGAVVSSAGGS